MTTATLSPTTVGTFPLWNGLAVVAVTDQAALSEAIDITANIIAAIDAAASTYRADSELSRLATGTNDISPVLRDLLEVALEVADSTGGLVDPTIGAITLAGPGTGWSMGRRASWRDVTVAGDFVALPEGVRLDLGASAKARAADLAAVRIHELTGVGVLVSLLGDLATAGQSPAGGWVVALADDHRAVADEAPVVRIQDGGIATSSSSVRSRLDAHGHTWTHVIDPHTGLPAASPWRTVTVAARDAVAANAASTGALAAGPGGLAFLARTGLPARLVAHDGTVTLLGGWPADAPIATLTGSPAHATFSSEG